MAGDDAMRKVFGTPELLEAILLKLPLRHLLTSQDVCKSWKYAIRSSPELQKSLFQATDDYVKGEIDWHNDSVRVEEAIAQHLNSSVVKLAMPDPQLSRALFSLRNAHDHFHSRKVHILVDFNPEWYNPWKDMFITYPPTSLATIDVEWKPSSRDRRHATYTLRDTAGIRLIDVLVFLKATTPRKAALHSCQIDAEVFDTENFVEGTSDGDS